MLDDDNVFTWLYKLNIVDNVITLLLSCLQPCGGRGRAEGVTGPQQPGRRRPRGHTVLRQSHRQADPAESQPDQPAGHNQRPQHAQVCQERPGGQLTHF